MKSAQAEGLKLLRAAIYARKSTDDNDRQAENKSTRLGALWAPETIMKMASPRGFEPRLPP
jgi:hypothetical protein